MEYAIDSTRGADEHVVGVVLSGRADFNALVALFRALERCAIEFGPLSILIDESALEAGIVGPNEIWQLLDMWNRSNHFNGSRVAVFAPDLALFGLNRMFELIGGDKTEPYFGVYRTRGDAERWLLPHRGDSPERRDERE